MEYLPGNIHEKLQVPIALEIINDFNVITCKCRFFTMDVNDDSQTETLELKRGDVLIVRLFKPHDDSITYTYIDKAIISNIEIDIKQESFLSGHFVSLNTDNKVLFSNITKMYNRDEIIDKLLYEKV